MSSPLAPWMLSAGNDDDATLIDPSSLLVFDLRLGHNVPDDLLEAWEDPTNHTFHNQLSLSEEHFYSAMEYPTEENSEQGVLDHLRRARVNDSPSQSPAGSSNTTHAAAQVTPSSDGMSTGDTTLVSPPPNSPTDSSSIFASFTQPLHDSGISSGRTLFWQYQDSSSTQPIQSSPCVRFDLRPSNNRVVSSTESGASPISLADTSSRRAHPGGLSSHPPDLHMTATSPNNHAQPTPARGQVQLNGGVLNFSFLYEPDEASTEALSDDEVFGNIQLLLLRCTPRQRGRLLPRLCDLIIAHESEDVEESSADESENVEDNTIDDRGLNRLSTIAEVAEVSPVSEVEEVGEDMVQLGIDSDGQSVGSEDNI